MLIRRSLALAVAAVALVVLASTAQAAPPPGDDENVTLEDPAAAFQHDVALIAARTGWNLAATANHLRVQSRFGDLLAKVVEQYPTYSAGILADQPGGTSVVRFKGVVPAGAPALVTAAGIAVSLVGGAKYSQTELRDRSKAVYANLTGQGYTDVVTAVMAAGFVDVTVGGNADAKPVLPPALRDDVRISVIAAATGPDEHTRGGAWAYNSTTGSACTTGFTVQDANGVTGVATAAHCTGLDMYDPPNGDPDYSMPFVAEHFGALGDMEWHTSSHVEPNEFYATATSIRNVTSVEPWTSIAVNNWYCFYGRSSNNRQCDDVYSTFVSSGGASFLVAMSNDNTIAGDSGGGWSFGNEAVGIHRGDKWIWFGTRNIWSIADLLPSALGVTVLH